MTDAPRLLFLLALVAVLAACGGEPTAVPTAPTPTTSAPTATPAATLTGTLEGDAQLEGGCAWLATTGGPDADVADQVMPLFPAGYTVEFAPDLQLVGPGGDVVATAGQQLVVDGAPAEAMATTCQVGPPYRVDEVLETGDG